MKKYFLLYKIFLLSLPAFSQITISSGTQWVNSGNVTMVLQNIDMVNDGTFTAGSGGVKFAGNQNSAISGNSMPLFNILEVSKINNTKVFLGRNISIGASINFISGQLDLNGKNILMATGANIAGESEINRIVGPNGGFVEITQSMNAPASVNAGNLGATITCSANLGTVTIRRGHLSQSGTGLTGSINRYYSIVPTKNTNLNATLRLKYFDTELNGQVENSLVVYQSKNNGTNWNNLSKTSNNTNTNYVEKTGVLSLALQTLANNNSITGATGVVLSGERKNLLLVKLQWTSQTETNMSGYRVQRRLKNEDNFSDRTFVNSLAPGGNSLSQLSYSDNDINLYTDTSFYRLKIVTLNGSFTYSNIITVPGKNKGGGGNNNNRSAEEVRTTTVKGNMPSVNSQKITVGPNPNNGNFWFSVNGIEKETIATLYTIDGKQISQFRIVNLQQQQVNNIRTGIYLLKIPGFETQKIIVNVGGNGVPQSTLSNNNTKL